LNWKTFILTWSGYVRKFSQGQSDDIYLIFYI
jgi:hypothetical protein